MSEPDILDQAAQLLSQGRFGDAERLCKSVLRRTPRNARALYLMGMSCCLREQYRKGAEWLEKARRIQPEDCETLYNLGKAYGILGRITDAIEAYQAALVSVPDHASTLNNLGMALIETGRTAEGTDCLRRLLAAHPGHKLAPVNLMNAECQQLPVTEWIAVCNRTLAAPDLSGDERYLALVQRGMAEWITGDIASLAATLRLAASALPFSDQSRYANIRRYETFLGALLAYRHENSSLYESGSENIFIVGDSHCLSYAGLRIGNATVKAHLIIGAKAWHISSPAPNQYTAALDSFMNSLPHSARLLCSFGEIDCRKDDGILPFLAKAGGDLEKTVTQQVERYVSAIATRAAAQNLRLDFIAVPTPHRDGFGAPQVAALFNRTLAACAAAAGHGYIDLYTETIDSVAAAGYSHGKLHIDLVHLKPETLLNVLK